MSLLPFLLPSPLPPDVVDSGPGHATADPFSLYDVAINGVGFEFGNVADNPLIRETEPPTQQRPDQPTGAGEQTLTNWWVKSQDSFHAGAGQLQLEPATPNPMTHARYDCSKNVDPFTPGRVSRLPDCARIVTGTGLTAVIGVALSGVDVVASLDTGTVSLTTSPLSISPVTSPFTFADNGTVKSIATDGSFIYAATTTKIYKLTPSDITLSTVVATYPGTSTTNPVLGWVKSRLLASYDSSIYEVDVSLTATALGSTELRYTHPTPTFTWRTFASGPQAVLAAGDAAGVSSVTALTVQTVAGAPVLEAAGDIYEAPVGERILSMLGVQGSFLAVGTTSGIRVGTYDAYYGRLTVGPLHLLDTDPKIACNAIAARGRFIYAAGRDYDETGLLTLALGTVVDDANRYAWAPSLITPAPSTAGHAVAVAVLPVSNRIVFAADSATAAPGIYLEGAVPGSGREAWLRTSRVRYGTAEPKLFKLCSVRGSLTTGEVRVDLTTAFANQSTIATVGFNVADPPEFKLPPTTTEWVQLSLFLLGSSPVLGSYTLKALPGTRRQMYIQAVLSLFDSETTRSGQRIRSASAARDRLASLEAVAATGEETVLQEFTPAGVISTLVVVEKVSYKQDLRPTKTSDYGGYATVTMRTVES